jgi:hypothetical protein
MDKKTKDKPIDPKAIEDLVKAFVTAAIEYNPPTRIRWW